jgi:hypothetical protein
MTAVEPYGGVTNDVRVPANRCCHAKRLQLAKSHSAEKIAANLIAGKVLPIEQQDAHAPLAEVNRGCGAGGPGPGYDDIRVQISPHMRFTERSIATQHIARSRTANGIFFAARNSRRQVPPLHASRRVSGAGYTPVRLATRRAGSPAARTSLGRAARPRLRCHEVDPKSKTDRTGTSTPRRWSFGSRVSRRAGGNIYPP